MAQNGLLSFYVLMCRKETTHSLIGQASWPCNIQLLTRVIEV